MKNLGLGLVLLLAAASLAAKEPVSITVSLAESRDTSATIDKNLSLRVDGDPSDYQVEVTSSRAVRGCYANLVYQAAHGPDPSGVLPWHVATKHFPNVRRVPVCGHRLVVEIRLIKPEIAGEGADARFTAGTLVVTVLPQSQ